MFNLFIASIYKNKMWLLVIGVVAIATILQIITYRQYTHLKNFQAAFIKSLPYLKTEQQVDIVVGHFIKDTRPLLGFSNSSAATATQVDRNALGNEVKKLLKIGSFQPVDGCAGKCTSEQVCTLNGANNTYYCAPIPKSDPCEGRCSKDQTCITTPNGKHTCLNNIGQGGGGSGQNGTTGGCKDDRDCASGQSCISVGGLGTCLNTADNSGSQGGNQGNTGSGSSSCNPACTQNEQCVAYDSGGFHCVSAPTVECDPNSIDYYICLANQAPVNPK